MDGIQFASFNDRNQKVDIVHSLRKDSMGKSEWNERGREKEGKRENERAQKHRFKYTHIKRYLIEMCVSLFQPCL